MELLLVSLLLDASRSASCFSLTATGLYNAALSVVFCWISSFVSRRNPNWTNRDWPVGKSISSFNDSGGGGGGGLNNNGCGGGLNNNGFGGGLNNNGFGGGLNNNGCGGGLNNNGCGGGLNNNGCGGSRLNNNRGSGRSLNQKNGSGGKYVRYYNVRTSQELPAGWETKMMLLCLYQSATCKVR